MRTAITTAWKTICTAWIALSGTLCVYATEQSTEPATRASQMLDIIDAIQKVCLWIVIVAVTVFIAWYVIKRVLRRMHVPPEEKEKKTDDEQNDS